MRFRNALHLFMSNFKNVYRLLIYKFVGLIIACALCCAFVLPEIQDILNTAQVQGLISNAKSFLKAFLSMDEELLLTSKEALIGNNGLIKQVVRYLTDMTTEIVWVSLGCLIVFAIKHFVDILCDFAIGSILNDKMTTYADTPFFTAYVSNLRKACKYAIVYVPVSFLFNVVGFGVSYFFISQFTVLVGLFLSITCLIVVQAVKMTIVGRWMPAETVGKNMLSDMTATNALEKRQRSKEFSCYLICIYIIVIINVMAATCTFGSALLITAPASYMLLICMQYVNYYTAKGKKYFLTYEQIEENAHFGDNENFFDYITQKEMQTVEENVSENEKGE